MIFFLSLFSRCHGACLCRALADGQKQLGVAGFLKGTAVFSPDESWAKLEDAEHRYQVRTKGSFLLWL